ncbi:MAG: lipid-A-disaccharide synthase, partial [Muribaculaceae bacterium]|nr:lipid-A-disaccharide synthase [Muribaculaceae bacterium]
MRYFLAAGEASGDLHASELIEQIKRRDTEAEFTFLGGDLMEKAAGVKPLIHYRDMAFMGFSEVLRNLSKIFGNLRRAKQGISESAPDRVILVDYPSFNLKLAQYAHQRGIRVDYYISPKIWAWKSWRIKKIRRYVSRMLSILPFEPEWYARHGFEATYVGNPSVEEIDRRLESLPSE